MAYNNTSIIYIISRTLGNTAWCHLAIVLVTEPVYILMEMRALYLSVVNAYTWNLY